MEENTLHALDLSTSAMVLKNHKYQYINYGIGDCLNSYGVLNSLDTAVLTFKFVNFRASAVVLTLYYCKCVNFRASAMVLMRFSKSSCPPYMRYMSDGHGKFRLKLQISMNYGS